VEQNNGVSRSSDEYKVHGILHCSDNLERYIAHFVQGASIEFMKSFIAEENWNIIAMPAFLRQVESRVSNTSSSKFQHCDANRVEYAYFSAPCGSRMLRI
jgi:hypothetical protein